MGGAKVSDITATRHNHSRANRTTLLLFSSSCGKVKQDQVLNICGHLGLLAKTTAVLRMRHFYFQLLSESSFLRLTTPLNPGPWPKCVSCQVHSLKRQMQKLCVDVRVWEWAGRPPGQERASISSKVSILDRTQLSGPQLCRLQF